MRHGRADQERGPDADSEKIMITVVREEASEEPLDQEAAMKERRSQVNRQAAPKCVPIERRREVAETDDKIGKFIIVCKQFVAVMMDHVLGLVVVEVLEQEHSRDRSPHQSVMASCPEDGTM